MCDRLQDNAQKQDLTVNRGLDGQLRQHLGMSIPAQVEMNTCLASGEGTQKACHMRVSISDFCVRLDYLSDWGDAPMVLSIKQRCADFELASYPP